MERFWKHVNKTNNCWEWTACGRGNGYGCFKYNGKVIDSHRFSWFLSHGKWPEQWILHTCNNRKCVNPDHLYEGTPQQNYQDMRASGREPERKKSPLSKKERNHIYYLKWYKRVREEPGLIKYKHWRSTQGRK